MLIKLETLGDEAWLLILDFGLVFSNEVICRLGGGPVPQVCPLSLRGRQSIGYTPVLVKGTDD